MWRSAWLRLIALSFFVAQPVSQGPAHAQLVIDHEGEARVRAFHGPRPLGGVKRSFQSDAEARAEFERIMATVGLAYISDRISLRASAETSNAEAGISENGERFIFYNATFMQKLKERTAEHWSLVSVLAHEIGHHMAFHTEIAGNFHKFELEADYFSGFVLRRLGATLDQSHLAMRAVSSKEATATHPGIEQRLQVITIGWTDAGAQGAVADASSAEAARMAAEEKREVGEVHINDRSSKAAVLTPPDRTEIVNKIQALLRSAGCYDGELDGVWGSRSGQALAKLADVNGYQMENYEVSLENAVKVMTGIYAPCGPEAGVSAADNSLNCAPIGVEHSLLAAPDKSKPAPELKGFRVGKSWSLADVQRLSNSQGRFLYGRLFSSRGTPQQWIYTLEEQWECDQQ